MPRKLKGIRRKGKGWQAFVRVAGKLRSKQFPIDHPVEKMRAWREQQIDLHGGRRAQAGTFRADVETFLTKPEIAAQPYVGQLARHLARWVQALDGTRSRAEIERDEIEHLIQGWLKRYAEPTVYHWRSALNLLYTTLDGAGAANPVKETTCPRSWIPKDHSVPFGKLAAIVAAMPDVCYPKKGIRKPSIAKLVGRVIVEVGIRPADLLKVRRTDVDWSGSAFRWPASAKGRGTAARTVPLTPAGLAAFTALDAAGAFGAFDPAAVSHSFKRAARQVDGDDTPIHLYTGRHTLGADLYRATGDLATVGRMLNHAPGSRATPQYAQGANADVDRAAVQALSASRQVQDQQSGLPKKLPAKAKLRRSKQLRSRA